MGCRLATSITGTYIAKAPAANRSLHERITDMTNQGAVTTSISQQRLEHLLDTISLRYEHHVDNCYLCRRGHDCPSAKSMAQHIDSAEQRLMEARR